MFTLSQLRRRLCALFPGKFEQDMDEELHFHLESTIQANIQSGMSEKEARRKALISLGGLDRTKEDCRDPRWTRPAEQLWRDLKFGFRMIRKYPGFTLSAVLILALGIGVNTAIFSFIDAVVFRPFPVRNPDALALIDASSFPDYQDLQTSQTVFSGLAAFAGLNLSAHTEDSEIVSGRAVSANFFQVLGLKMAAGRGFQPGDDAIPDGHDVAVISYRFWQRQFGGRQSAIGQSIKLNGEPLTVIGVAPKNFQDLVVGGRQDVWVPIPLFGKVMHLNQLPIWREAIGSRDQPWLSLVGRLNDGITMEQAQAQLDTVVHHLKKSYHRANNGWLLTLSSLNRTRWPDRNSLFPFAVLLGAAVCILILTCTNVANLLLARGSARGREIAARISLGASRGRIICQLLAESSVLSVLSIAISMGVCILTMKLLPIPLGAHNLPMLLDLKVDQRALAIAIIIGLLTNLLFGLAPALVSSRTNVNSALKDKDAVGRIRTPLFRRILVIVQIALSVVLLIIAGLLTRTILRFRTMDMGYNRGVLLVKSDFLGWGGIDADGRITQGVDFYSRSLDRIRDLPGVRFASWGEDLPLDADHPEQEISPDEAEINKEKWLRIACNSISSGYFSTVGIPIVQGRDFAGRDNNKSPNVVIVNEALANMYWPGETPVGKRIRVRGRTIDVGTIPTRTYEVIGVAKNVRYRSLIEKPQPYAYFNYAQGMMYFHMDLHVYAHGNPHSLVEPIKKACASINSKVAMRDVRLMSNQLDLYLSQELAAVSIFGVFGPLSLILAAVGLYGIVSYSVMQRSHEFGIRLALGSRRKSILLLVVRESLVSTLIGLAIGFPAGLYFSRLIVGRLHGINPLDPITYAVVCLLCVAVSISAALIPARNACLINPGYLLRQE
jgi:predicted permease